MEARIGSSMRFGYRIWGEDHRHVIAWHGMARTEACQGRKESRRWRSKNRIKQRCTVFYFVLSCSVMP
jgi:hypothetical protein